MYRLPSELSSRPSNSSGSSRFSKGVSRMFTNVQEVDAWMREIDYEKNKDWQVGDRKPHPVESPKRPNLWLGRKPPSEISDLVAFQNENDWAEELVQQFQKAHERGEKEIKDAQLRIFLSSVPDDQVVQQVVASHNSPAEMQVLPHGWWRLKVSVFSARDMERQASTKESGAPEVNPFVEISWGNKHTFRTRVIPYEQLRQTEDDGQLHDTVATFENESVTLTLDHDWFKHPLMVKLYHWRPSEYFTSQTDTYLSFDSYGVPTHVLNGAEINDRIRDKLREEMKKHTQPVLLAFVELSLEWYRQGPKAGWINLRRTNGKMDCRNYASVLMKFEPTVPRPKTAAEMKETTRLLNLRHMYATRAAALYTPVPSAHPYVPPKSSWGRHTALHANWKNDDFEDEEEDEESGKITETLQAKVLFVDSRDVLGNEGSLQKAEEQHLDAGQEIDAPSSTQEQTPNQILRFGSDGTENPAIANTVASNVVESTQWEVLQDVEKKPKTQRPRIEDPEYMKFVPKTMSFEWSGIIGWLASDGRRGRHLNPAERGLIRLTASSPWVWGRVENVVEHAPKPSASPSEKGAWICIELRHGLKLSPTHYSLRHGLVGSGRVLRNWRLLGSANGSDWICLRDHKEDYSMLQSESDPLKDAQGVLRAADFPRALAAAKQENTENTGFKGQAVFSLLEMPKQTKVFPSPEELRELDEKKEQIVSLVGKIEACAGLRFFRIELTGPDTSTSYCICLSGFELYGQVHLDWDILLQGIESSSSDKRLYLCRVMRAVAKRGHREAIFAAQKLVEDEDEEVAQEARDNLAALGIPPGLVYFEPPLDASGATYFLWQGEPCPPLRATASGTWPHSFSSEPALPSGLAIDQASGLIIGTPIIPQDRATYTIKCSSFSGSSSSPLSLEVLPVPVAVGAAFKFSSDFDGLGLMHFLSTRGGKGPQTNPFISGAVQLHTSGWLTDPKHILENAEHPSCSLTRKNAWFSICLPDYLWLLPTRYSLMHGHGTDSHVMRNWELLGSSDGESWTVLRRHEDDSSLSGRFATCTWSVGQSGPLRMFKVRMSGFNSTFGKDMRVCGFEIYGKILIGRPARALDSPHWFIREWALEALLRGLDLQRQIADLEGNDLTAAEAIVCLDGMGFECSSLKERLCSLVGDEDADVRRASLSMLPLVAARGEDRVLQIVIRALKDTDNLVRQTAVLALTELVAPGDRNVVLVLMDAAIEQWLQGLLTVKASRKSTASSQRWQLGSASQSNADAGSKWGFSPDILRDRVTTAPDTASSQQSVVHGRRADSAVPHDRIASTVLASFDQPASAHGADTATLTNKDRLKSGERSALKKPGTSLKDLIIPSIESNTKEEMRRRRTGDALQREISFTEEQTPNDGIEGVGADVQAGQKSFTAPQGQDRGGKTRDSRRGVTFYEDDLELEASLTASRGASSWGGRGISSPMSRRSSGGVQVAFFDDADDDVDENSVDLRDVSGGHDIFIRGLIAAAGDDQGRDALRQVFGAATSSHGRRRWQPFVLPHTQHATWFVRLAAVRVLSALALKGDDQAISATIQLTRDKEALVRREAAKALGRLAHAGDPGVKQHIVSMLGDDDVEVVRELSSALAALSAVPTMYHDNKRLDSAPNVASSTIGLARTVRGAESAAGSELFDDNTSGAKQSTPAGTDTALRRLRPRPDAPRPDAPRPPTAVRAALVDSFMKQQEQSVQISVFPRHFQIAEDPPPHKERLPKTNSRDLSHVLL